MKMDLLQQLRDIHYPAPIPIWPLTIGWYVVIVLTLILLVTAGYYAYRSYVKQRLKRLVLQRLLELEQQDTVAINVAAELSVLLKRCALARFARSHVAGLYGEQWLAFLDKTSMTDGFTTGPGRLLIVSPYRAQHDELPATLFHLIRAWVKKNL
jgi:general stress protein CsbA